MHKTVIVEIFQYFFHYSDHKTYLYGDYALRRASLESFLVGNGKVQFFGETFDTFQKTLCLS